MGPKRSQGNLDRQYVDNHPHDYKIYILVSVLVYVAILVTCQIIGAFCWQDEAKTEVEDTDSFPSVSPTGHLSEKGFERYATIVLWITVVVTGLGTELVVGEPLILYMGNSPVMVQAWKFSQLLFSLLIAVALFSRSPFGFPFLVMGLWKFGFPETFGSFRRAFRIGQITYHSVDAYLNAIGTLVHHSAAAYLVVACTTGLMTLDRRILSLSLPLVAQHIVVLVKYVDMNLYALCEIILEVIFEWEVFANLGGFTLDHYDVSCRGTALTMVAAHWCYWGAAFSSFIPKLLCKDPTFDKEITAKADGEGLTFDHFTQTLFDRGIYFTERFTKEQAHDLFVLSDEDHSGTIDKEEATKLLKRLKILFPTIDKKEEEVFEMSRKQTSQKSLSGTHLAQSEKSEYVL